MLASILVLSAALLAPLRPPLALRRAAVVRMAEGPDTDQAAGETAWPEPAFTVSELQAAQATAKEAAEAEAMASPMPFIEEGGGFSFVALATVLVFVAGGSLFFQGISGGGVVRFADGQTPEVQACIKQATTRDAASACLPPVPLA
eukprot:501892-Prymnesium_polylepis.1